MKETVLDVLMYLFENYMDEGPEFNPDQEALTTELTQAGFPRGEVNKAFSWLEELSALRSQSAELGRAPTVGTLRHYSPRELEKLDAECRGLILFMEQSGALDAVARELIIDRLMALEVEEISPEQLKWVMLLVLFNQPEQESAYDMLESLVFDQMRGQVH